MIVRRATVDREAHVATRPRAEPPHLAQPQVARENALRIEQWVLSVQAIEGLVEPAHIGTEANVERADAHSNPVVTQPGRELVTRKGTDANSSEFRHAAMHSTSSR